MYKTAIHPNSLIVLPTEALDALDVEPGAELEVEIVGRALVIRSVEEARRSGEFMKAFDSILATKGTKGT